MKPSSEILASAPAKRAPAFDVQRIREDFPILQTSSNGKKLVYLDNGATTQKPRQVIDAIKAYYESQNANIHRGVYALSQTATALYDQTRTKIRKFINAAEDHFFFNARATTERLRRQDTESARFRKARPRAGCSPIPPTRLTRTQPRNDQLAVVFPYSAR